MSYIYYYYVLLLLLLLLLLVKYKFYTAITTILKIHDKCMINNIMIEIFIYAWIDGASGHYLDGFLESNSRICDLIRAVLVTSSDGLRNNYEG